MKTMKSEYGSKKGKSVFYASKNAGKLHGVDHGFYGEADLYPKMNRIINTKGGDGYHNPEGDKYGRD